MLNGTFTEEVQYTGYYGVRRGKSMNRTGVKI